MSLVVLDPNGNSNNSGHRGGGRFVQMLRENLAQQIKFVDSTKEIKSDDTLLVPFWNPFQSPLVKKRFAKTQILTIFDVIPFKYPDKFPIGFRGKLGLIDSLNHLKHFDRYLTISEASKKDIILHLNIAPELIDVVHLTTNSLFFNKLEKETPHQDLPNLPFCVYVGDINWNKNITNIARGLKIAQMKGVFIGKAFTQEHKDIDHPWLAEFKAFKKECGNDDQFVFPGYVSDEELTIFYQKAVCNLLVSHDEGFGLSYLEASTQKCPSILSDISVFNEIADGAALFADPQDPQSIAEKIVRLQNDTNFRKELSQKSYARVRNFKPEKFAKKMLAVLEK